MSRFGTIDICCGMGGLSYAAKNAGLSILAGIDISKDALSTYKQNFPDAIIINGNINDLNVIEQNFEVVASRRCNGQGTIIISGPPCQGFSDAGPGCPEDPRNEILVAVAKAIAQLRPEAALVENVPALSKQKFSTLVSRFHETLNSEGYHVYCFKLNALDFGVPQNRQRLFCFILPFEIEKQRIQDEIKSFQKTAITVKDILGDLPVPSERPLKYIDTNDNGPLPNHYTMRHSEKVRKKIAAIQPGKGPLSYRKLDPDSQAATLLSGHRAPPVHYEHPRSITVREALRLQGFPDDFRVMGKFANQMGQVTNAVPVPLGIAALNVLLNVLGE